MERLIRGHRQTRSLYQVGDQGGGEKWGTRLKATDQMRRKEKGQRVLPMFWHKNLEAGGKESGVELGTNEVPSK